MRIHRNVVRCLVAAVLTAPISTPLFAANEAAPEQLHVAVFRDYVGVGPMRFFDLVELKAWIDAQHAQVRSLDNCEAQATPQLLAAVARFYPAESGVLEVRALPAAESICRLVVPLLPDAMYLETDAEGHSIIP